MQAEVPHRRADCVAHERTGAVAADDVARGQRIRSAGHHVPDVDGRMIARISDGPRLVPETDLHVREPRYPRSKCRVELRLVEVPVVRPAVPTGAVGPTAHHEGLARRVDEVHSARCRARDLLDRPGQAGRLEDAHDLAVEVHRPRQGVDAGIALQHQHPKPVPAEKVGQQRADRAEADYDDVELRFSHPAARPSGRRGPPSRLRAR